MKWLIPVMLSLTACGGSGGGGGGTPRLSSPDLVSGRVPDTGQTYCYYDYTLDSIFNPTASTCLPPGSGWAPDGQDGYYTVNAMSFTDNGDGTVLDNVTGLTWRKCHLGRSGSSCSSGSSASYTWSVAEGQCAQLGNGWRLPTASELTRIVHFGTSYSTIDTTAFPGTAPSQYWSSTAHPSYAGMAWYVSFAQGNTSLDNQTAAHYVRCVRG